MHPLLRSGLWGVAAVANARRPFIRNRVLTMPSFGAAWATTEFAGPWMAWHLFNSARLIRRRGLGSTQAKVGLALEAITVAGLAKLVLEGRRSEHTYEAALSPVLDASQIEARPRSNRAGEVLPVVSGASKRTTERGVAYQDGRGWRNTLDIYQPRTPGVGRPVIVQIHGGGWVSGTKNDQGVPLLNHLAGNGWLGFSVNYRLAPRVSMADQIVDLKSALAWVRTHAAEYGGDPDFIAVTGGSAGGHLSSLLALTANDPQFQPGFEHIDTSIAAAVPFYGVYDLLDEDGHMVPGFRDFIGRVVVKEPTGGERDHVWREYSPLHRVHAGAPPMMLVHGSVDTLVPVEQGRSFARRLTDVSDNPVVYVELAGANHAFDMFPSPRTVRTVEYVERFLTGIREGTLG